jgi:endonuclease/exonuclease/phosphatase (EEP) superfamily protein YafD
MKVLMFLIKAIGFLVGFGALGLVGMALAGPIGFPFELFASWPYLIAALGTIGAIVAGVCRWPRLGTIVFVGALLLVAIAMASPGDLSRARAPKPDPANHHLIWGNVLGYQANIAELMSRVENLNQAVLATGEVPRLWNWKAIPSRASFNAVRGGGIAVEGCAAEPRLFRNEGRYGGAIRMRTFALRVQCEDYVLYAVHLTNPLWEMGLRHARRNEELVELATAIEAETSPIVIVGDFNIPPNAPPFSRFIKAAKVAHTSCGGRWLPTWRPYGWRTKFKDGNPLTGIPIDHLFTRDIEVVSCTVGKDFGSDHLPLVVEFNISKKGNSP